MKNRSGRDTGCERIVVSEASALQAQSRVAACQACSHSVSRPFSALLTEAHGADRPVSEYVLSVVATCPSCGAEIVEDTLVRTDGDLQTSATEGSVENLARDWREHWCDEGDPLLITEEQLLEAQAFIGGCVRCTPGADLLFIYILDELTGSDPATTSYVLCRPARCPSCDGPVTEKTLVVVGSGPADAD